MLLVEIFLIKHHLDLSATQSNGAPLIHPLVFSALDQMERVMGRSCPSLLM